MGTPSYQNLIGDGKQIDDKKKKKSRQSASTGGAGQDAPSV
jgi:hypothetical protein